MNTRHDLSVLCTLVAISIMAACGGSPEDVDTDVGEARSAALNANALNANALNANALYPNALTPSMLGSTALVWSSLSASAQAALQDPGASGALARQLARYATGCAFDTTQSFSVSWTDSLGTHNETYVGELGLATRWAQGPLNTEAQQWVSACLASRVNYFGVSVMLSSRAAALSTSGTELTDYPAQEGAFWGNLFTSTPAVYACDYVPDDAHSRAAYRVCAAGYDDGTGTLQSCGIIQRLGSCANTCGQLGNGQYYDACSSDGGLSSSAQVITVFLP
jgi:hypothetical protein